MTYFSRIADSVEHGLRTTLNIIFKVLNVFSQLHLTLNVFFATFTVSVLDEPAARAEYTHSVATHLTSALPD